MGLQKYLRRTRASEEEIEVRQFAMTSRAHELMLSLMQTNRGKTVCLFYKYKLIGMTVFVHLSCSLRLIFPTLVFDRPNYGPGAALATAS